MDTLTKEERSHRMSLVRGKDTMPEKLVRCLVHRLGYRFRLHVRNVPGCPDLVFRSRSKVIFVHGCFWHQHKGCKKSRLPTTRTEYWIPKLKENRRRDIRIKNALTRQGWRYLVVWECEIKNEMKLTDRLRDFLVH